jgi:hypothetical protein
MSLRGGAKAMLLGVQATLLAIVVANREFERVGVVLGAVGTFLVVDSYRFD